MKKKLMEEKRNLILKSLEFITGDSIEAQICRLSRPTDSFKLKTVSTVKYAKEIKKINENFEKLPYNTRNITKQNYRYSRRNSKLVNFYQSKFGFKGREAMTIQSLQNLTALNKPNKPDESGKNAKANAKLREANLKDMRI